MFLQRISRSRISHARHRHLLCEPLEDRRLLAVITVDTDMDVVDAGDGLTSLREAISDANTMPDADDIVFDFGHDGPTTILLEQGELVITDELTITGGDAALLTIDASGNDPSPHEDNRDGSRVFYINGNPVTIQGVTLTGGDADEPGGAILTEASLTVISSTITGNSGDGAVVAYYGNVSVIDSTIDSNRGGGVFGSFDDALTITDSTIQNNDGEGVGGEDVTVVDSLIAGNSSSGISGFRVRVSGSSLVDNGGGGVSGEELTVVNSTISGNVGGGVAGYNVAVNSSTITGNSAEYSDSGGVSGYNTRIKNSIVAGNTTSGNAPDVWNELDFGSLSVEYSLIGDNTGSTLFEAPVGAPDANGNLIGGPIDGLINPALGLLAYNGGQTPTYALLDTSPALNAGDPSAVASSGQVPEFDQRGAPYGRVVTDRIDMGAHERQNLNVEILAVASPTVTPVDEVTIEFTSSVTGFEVGDMELTLNGGTNLLTGGESLVSGDNQTFVLGGLASVTNASGYYALTLLPAESNILDAGDGPLDQGASINWVMGRSELGLTVNTLVDEVDGNIDDGDISLRDALLAAAPGEAIDFAPELDGGTIVLTLGEVALTRPVTIDATALSSGLIVDAVGNDPTPDVNDGGGTRVFQIDDGSSSTDSPVTLRGLTLTGGDVSDTGGAINAKELLTIVSSTITGNAAGREGGGISGRDVTVIDSTIEENLVGSDYYGGIGGGISADQVTVTGSTISGNEASHQGGGIFGSDVTIAGSLVFGNAGYWLGGGVRGDVVTVTGSTISQNTAQRFGGGISGDGVTVINSTIAGNSTESEFGFTAGGGISVGGTLAVIGSSISDNTTTGVGGGVFGGSGDITIDNSTISGNSANNAGGISGAYAVTITNSTITLNTAEGDGGGISTFGDVTVSFSTVVGNSAGDDGGGVLADGGSVTVEHSIVAQNLSDTAPDLSSPVLVVQHSLVGDNAGTLLTEAPLGTPDADGNLIGGPIDGVIDPLLAPLADNGGLTATHALLPGSPAVDAGDPLAVAGVDDVPEFDQRGTPYPRVAGGRIDMGAHERQSLTVEIVDVVSPTMTPVDEVTIQFSSEVSGFDLSDLTLTRDDGDNLLTGSEPLTTSDDQTFVLGGLAGVTATSGRYTLELIAAGSEIVDTGGGLVDSGDRLSWVMRTVVGLTVNTLMDEADGNIDDGDISLRDAIAAAAPDETIDFASSLDGGTILLTLGEIDIPRSLTIDASALGAGLLVDASGNDSTPEVDDGDGSRIFLIDDGSAVSDSPVTIRGLSLAGGDVSGEGGAILAHETVTIASSDISHNAATQGGGGISAADVTVVDSTISDNVAGQGGGGILATEVTITGSILSRNDGGGVMATEVVVVGSTVSGNSSGSGIQADTVAVTDSTISNNSANSGGGIQSGRFAFPGPGFESGGVTVIGSTIVGNHAKFDGGGIQAFGEVNVTDTTLFGNSADDGGGLSASYANVTITDSTISGNSADSRGGGLHGNFETTLTVNGSTLSGNWAGRSGGGVFTQDILNVNASTVWANSSFETGGISAWNTVNVSGSIVAGNTDGGFSPDLYGFSSEAPVVQYSLIGDNTGSGLSEAPVGAADADGNLIGGPTGGVIDPRLGALSGNGGPTFTHALLAGSPAIDAGDPLAVAGVGDVPEFDQRGTPYSRVMGGRIDTGAHERQNLTVDILDVVTPTVTPVNEVSFQFSSPASGLEIDDLELVLNGGTDLLTGAESLTTGDNQSFVLSGLADVTSASGYYTLTLAPADSQIVDAAGGPLDAGDSVSWAMGRSVLGLTVNTLADEADGSIDDGDVSLRDAVAAAAPGETIDFAAALDGGSISLTLGEIAITRSLTIDATALGAGLTIDAAGNDTTPDVPDGKGSRIFQIDNADIGTDSPVIIQGVALTGGDVRGDGGAIHSREPLTVVSSAMTDNAAERGGGISATNDLTVTASTISSNAAVADGGGIRGSGVVTVTGSTISENRTDGLGAGIRGFGDVLVTASTIADNVAIGNGGGIYGERNVFVTDSRISDNSADDGAGIDGRDVTLIGSTISGNASSDDGGGILGRDVTATNSIISGNSASSGGGILSSDVTLIGSEVSRNLARGDGGGILTSDDVTVTDSTISDNTAGRAGGGINATDVVIITNSTISGNSSDKDGGGIRASLGAVTVNNSTISDNSSNDDGGAILAKGDVTIIGSTITGNSAPDESGGVWNDDDSVTIRNSILAGNSDSGAAPDLRPGTGTLIVEYSLIGSNRGTGLSEAPVGAPDADGNLIGGPVNGAIDPLLGPLFDNGGPTWTHALLIGSPAIDAGDPAAVGGVGDVPEFDQRGAPYSRVVDGDDDGTARIDMGAFEVATIVEPVIVGDMDGDSLVNFADLTPFALGLTDVPAFEAAYPDLASTRVERGDIDEDGFFNFGDLTPFVTLLTSDQAAAGNSLDDGGLVQVAPLPGDAGWISQPRRSQLGTHRESPAIVNTASIQDRALIAWLASLPGDEADDDTASVPVISEAKYGADLATAVAESVFLRIGA